MTSAWLLQSHYHQQLIQHKINSLNERNAIKQQYLQSMQSQTSLQLQSLTEKVGQLQAQGIKLNSLGERIIEKSNFPKEEFEFELNENTEQNTKEDIPTSTLNNPAIVVTPELTILNKSVSQLAYQYEKSQNLLQQLEITLNNLHLVDELFISGRPVPDESSWISSPFGTRSDPFTGRLRRHNGVDIAGYTGMPINATAAGVITTSEARTGYGFLVEINHGNGFKTRYAHASSLVVSVGDVVEKGQQIAVMGTTGRSTGPHVHYEVIKDGRQINPNYYIQRLPS
ncbi:M23 family metallopeptidase [Psychromonas sp. L1A2]|uniref:M23 family metallopeptidase n=1 Tax=Psychromonas sp. L1A2 TaxID=2686356 RepID=UPI001F3F8CBE|nr:M23 family metallopeptidase [Psychromonas sp. L1A2]